MVVVGADLQAYAALGAFSSEFVLWCSAKGRSGAPRLALKTSSIRINLFWEGGAGTYSDGKLYTRSKKRGDIREALEWLVAHGADPHILVESHPHIGTNRLPAVVTAMRETVEAGGGVVHFDTRVTGLIREEGRCTGVKVGDQTFHGEAVVLATGHSARDVFHMMVEEGLEVEAKPFALGVRVEHPQGWVDEVLHGETVEDRLPPASYSLVYPVEGRGVHGFCMCGRLVAPCATSPGVVITGDAVQRNNPYANSGMVVQVGPEDWGLRLRRPPGGLQFRRPWSNVLAVTGRPKLPRRRLETLCMAGHPATTKLVPPGCGSARLDQVLPGWCRAA